MAAIRLCDQSLLPLSLGKKSLRKQNAGKGNRGGWNQPPRFSLSKKSVFHAIPVTFAGQRLPLEGKLAAQPTDEVARKAGKKQGFLTKTQDFHLIRPVCALGTFPSRGRLEKVLLFLALWFFDSLKGNRGGWNQPPRFSFGGKRKARDSRYYIKLTAY